MIGTPADHIRPRHTALGVLVVLLAILVLAGCSRLQKATIPPQESTVIQTRPQVIELGEMPPMEPTGTLTMPTTRAIITDTTVTVGVSRVEVDNRPNEQAVRMWWRRGGETVQDNYQMPVYGEMLRWAPESHAYQGAPTTRPRDTPPDTIRDTVRVRAEVIGTPQPEDVEARIDDYEPPWWRRTWMQIRLLLAFLGGGVFGYVATKLIPGL